MGKRVELSALCDDALNAQITDHWVRIRAVEDGESEECQLALHIALFDFEEEREGRNPREMPHATNFISGRIDDLKEEANGS